MTIDEAIRKYSLIAPWLADDILSEAALANVEALEFGHKREWVVERIVRFSEEAIRVTKLEVSQPKIESGIVPQYETRVFLTKKQRNRLLRDRAIRLARQGGMTVAELSIVHGLSLSLIKSITNDRYPLDLQARLRNKRRA